MLIREPPTTSVVLEDVGPVEAFAAAVPAAVLVAVTEDVGCCSHRDFVDKDDPIVFHLYVFWASELGTTLPKAKTNTCRTPAGVVISSPLCSTLSKKTS